MNAPATHYHFKVPRSLSPSFTYFRGQRVEHDPDKGFEELGTIRLYRKEDTLREVSISIFWVQHLMLCMRAMKPYRKVFGEAQNLMKVDFQVHGQRSEFLRPFVTPKLSFSIGYDLNLINRKRLGFLNLST